MSVWDRRKEILYGNGSVGEVRQSTPLQSVRSMGLSAMMVEQRVIYLFIYAASYTLQQATPCCTPGRAHKMAHGV